MLAVAMRVPLKVVHDGGWRTPTMYRGPCGRAGRSSRCEQQLGLHACSDTTLRGSVCGSVLS